MEKVKLVTTMVWIALAAITIACSSGRRASILESHMTVDGIPEDGNNADGAGGYDGWLDDVLPQVDGWWQDPGPGEPCSLAPFEFSCPCDGNEECESGYCVEGPDGFVCTTECVEDCPSGWSCKVVTVLGDPVFLCFPDSKKLCHSCELDAHCDEGICIDMADGSFCSYPCDAKDPCPEGYFCPAPETVDTAYCLPDNGSCECSEETEGKSRPCGLTNQYGSCAGFETCDPAVGWQGCTAAFPWKEECDGMDNDCDGEVDEDLPVEVPCTNAVENLGSCQGWAHCQGSAGWICDAPVPEKEVCDYSDNDCDGKADENYMVGNQYGTVQHCGECNLDCNTVVPNAIPSCDYMEYKPVCKVKECLPGFYQLDEFLCIPPPDVQCLPCVDDSDCYLGACVPLDGGHYCLNLCSEGECQEGFHCQQFPDGAKACAPDNQTCECTPATAGMKRGCAKENEAGSCFGFETCAPDVGWTECDASDPAVELCDGVDNDCDGIADESLAATVPCQAENEWGICPGDAVCMGSQGWVCQAAAPQGEVCDYSDNDCDGEVDEDFISGGKYHLDEHCGACNSSCATVIANGTGKCSSEYATPKCVVDECFEGFAPVSPFECQLPPDTTCQPCETAYDCAGHPCIGIDGKGRCAAACVTDLDCQGETSCLPYPGSGFVCKPDSGSCECNSSTAGEIRGCTLENNVGICYGLEMCDPSAGWKGCNAPLPAPEICNGFDDDCNGFVDDGFPNPQLCVTGNQWGECIGDSICMGLQGWTCQAPEPGPEACDYVDNDCDGLVDEDFTNEAGEYAHYDHCGSCTLSCDGWFPNAIATCDDSTGLPECIIEACEPGYVLVGEAACVSGVAGLCEECSQDEECALEGAMCIALPEGNYCSRHCDGDGDCPQGYACQPYLGDQQCFPLTGSCTCDGGNFGMTRSCSFSWPLNPAPGQDSYTCFGTQVCTPYGWTACDIPEDTCDTVDNDCNGVVDDNFVFNGKYVTAQHCRQCGNDCTFLIYPNASGECDGSLEEPECFMACYPGYVDVNDNPVDGCECKQVDELDLPDADCIDPPECTNSTKDQNCDGVDGEVDNAVFVAKNGSDDNPGTIAEPLLSIEAGISKAESEGKRDVYVATGLYNGSIGLKNGIGVYGGYSADFLQRSTLLYESVIVGNSFSPSLPGAVTAVDIFGAGGTTVLDGFTIIGGNNSQPGGSSYAVYLNNCSAKLEVTNNNIIAGNGGNGQGGAGGADGFDGENGAAGVDALYYFQSKCTTSAAILEGGSPGFMKCGAVDISGGDGGDSHCPYFYSLPKSGEYGAAGQGTGGGEGGHAGFDSDLWSSCDVCTVHTEPGEPTEGGDGGNGAAGGHGAPGDGAAAAGNGVNADGFWVAATGGPGGDGGHGSGGGGGGTGSGADGPSYSWSCHDHIGGTGGGGGSGGCAGTGAAGGAGGGASFGLFVLVATPPTGFPLVADNLIQGGAGGTGGAGGVAGSGGAAGAGGIGGLQGYDDAWCADGGGTGGDGGPGGHGGGGGGGAGGAAYCIYVHQQQFINLDAVKTGNEFVPGTGGTGGPGGPSIGNPGLPGTAGLTSLTNF